MKRSFLLGACFATIILAFAACNLPTNPDVIQHYLSQTQTAEAPIAGEFQESSDAAPAESPPPGLEPNSRCDLFAGLELPVYLLEVYANSSSLVIYFEFPGGVIGLEDGTDDGVPWEYSATLGDVQSLWCTVFEEVEYAGRLYCMLPLPKAYHNATRPFAIMVNHCETPIVSIPKLSVMVSDTPEAGSAGGTTGGSESGEETEGILGQGIFGIFTTVCGTEPASHTNENNGYREWCECMGGEYSWEVWYNMAGIEDGTMQYCTFP